MWHAVFTRDMPLSHVTRPIHSCHDSSAWYDYILRHTNMKNSIETWLIHIWNNPSACDMPYSYVTCLIHTWHDPFTLDMTHPRVMTIFWGRQTWTIHAWHDSLTHEIIHPHVTCRIHTWHASFTRDMPYSLVTWLTHVVWLYSEADNPFYFQRLFSYPTSLLIFTGHTKFFLQGRERKQPRLQGNSTYRGLSS